MPKKPKKTVVLSVKVTDEMHDKAHEIAARRGSGTVSSLLRDVVADIIEKDDRGERLAEPIQVLTTQQRQILEAAGYTSK